VASSSPAPKSNNLSGHVHACQRLSATFLIIPHGSEADEVFRRDNGETSANMLELKDSQQQWTTEAPTPTKKSSPF
jgi:hypothetical protein